MNRFAAWNSRNWKKTLAAERGRVDNVGLSFVSCMIGCLACVSMSDWITSPIFLGYARRDRQQVAVWKRCTFEEWGIERHIETLIEQLAALVILLFKFFVIINSQVDGFLVGSIGNEGCRIRAWKWVASPKAGTIIWTLELIYSGQHMVSFHFIHVLIAGRCFSHRLVWKEPSHNLQLKKQVLLRSR